MALRAAVLETLLTVNLDDVAKAETTFKQTGERIEKKPIKGKVDADSKPFMDAMGKVEQEAKRVVSRETALTVNANIDRADKAFDRAQKRLDYLKSVETTMNVEADIKRAEANLQRIERNRDGLVKARAEMVVEVDGGKARKELQDVASFAEAEAKSGGKKAGTGLVSSMDSATRGAGEKVGQVLGDDVGSTLESALQAIPVAGGILLAAGAIGKAIIGQIRSGMAQEVGRDRIQALTGIDPAEASRLAFAAGEAYANVFGESIEANLNAAQLGTQFGIIDPSASVTASRKIIEGLSGVADVLGEDVRPVAQAVAVLLQSGVARNTQHAFDILAAGAREGVNRSEDLLDTFTEYPALFARLGLSGEEALGLINQGLDAGARNSDLAADALKEFQLRVQDGQAADGFRILGMNAERGLAQVAAGGEGAREVLREVLSELGDMEAGSDRSAAALAFFGTKAEDLGDSLFAMDLDTAVASLNGVEGAAQRMFDTLTSNDASAIERAQRNVEVAVAGIQGALATAFSDPLTEAADWISQNRGPMMEFFAGLVNGALDFGASMVESTATGTEALGVFVAGPLREAVIAVRDFLEWLPGDQDTSGLDSLIDSMEGFDEETATAAGTIRDTLLPQIEDARSRVNEFLDPQIALGYLNDATLRFASSIGAVGLAADGVTPLIDAYTVAQDGTVQASSEFEGQVRNSIGALLEEVAAAEAAGESQAELGERYNQGRESLLQQMEAMGLTREQAQSLIDTILATPTGANTVFSSNAAAVEAGVDTLAQRIITLPDGTVIVTADTSPAEVATGDWIRQVNGRRVRVFVDAVGGSAVQYQVEGSNVRLNARGALLEYFADGGFHGARGLTPMAPVAQMVPQNTWRVVGDRSDVAEAYIPLDGSARSMEILAETMRRMGVMPMGDGGVVAVAPASTPSGDRPITLDGAIVAWLREFVDGRAQIVLAHEGRVAGNGWKEQV